MTDSDVYERLSLLEAQVRYLSERTGIPLPDFRTLAAATIPPQVQAEIAKGNKINAIKLYREATGCDLATAKSVGGGRVRGSRAVASGACARS